MLAFVYGWQEGKINRTYQYERVNESDHVGAIVEPLANPQTRVPRWKGVGGRGWRLHEPSSVYQDLDECEKARYYQLRPRACVSEIFSGAL